MKAVRFAALACAVLVAPALPAAADDLTPVRLDVRVAPIARLHQPLSIAVAVTADAGVLDIRDAPLRVRAKLATVCGASFEHTAGTVLLDAALSPQPATGAPFSTSVGARRRPPGYGVFNVCAFLEGEGDDRLFASSTDSMVDVSRPCTERARSYDRARRTLRRKPSATRRKRVARLRANARAACGAGVTL